MSDEPETHADRTERGEDEPRRSRLEQMLEYSRKQRDVLHQIVEDIHRVRERRRTRRGTLQR